MTFKLLQYRSATGDRGVAARHELDGWFAIPGVTTVLELVKTALDEGQSLADAVAARGKGTPVDPGTVTLLPPIDHPDPAHLYLTGTGLTHLGSAEGRDKMHKAAAAGDTLTDSMRMFLMGVEGGKPAGEGPGAQPEWFYKGNGLSLVAPGTPLVSPAFALDAGEEPELALIYYIDADGTPVRLGCALANEFSDHVTERQNYLWLAHSKLRQAALGPELLVGEIPAHIEGKSRILRDGKILWEKPFLTGEENMSHSLANLEYHHFKYGLFRQPGDIHVHFLGTATLSCTDGITTRPGDIFEIEARPFSLPVRNPIAVADDVPVSVRGI